MIWAFFAAVAVGLVAVFAALVAGRLNYDPMAPATHTAPDPGFPDAPAGEPIAARIDDVRFDTALRGYRMDQVDNVIAQLQNRLAQVEAQMHRGGVEQEPSAPGGLTADSAALTAAESTAMGTVTALGTTSAQAKGRVAGTSEGAGGQANSTAPSNNAGQSDADGQDDDQ